MPVKKIESTEELNNSIEDGVSLVDFSAPWCAPCNAQEPIVRQISEEFKGKALIAEVDVQANQDTARDLKIQSIPTLAVFKNGKEVKRFVGLQPKEVLSDTIEELLL